MSGTTTFDPNVTSKSFNLMLVSDDIPELDEKLVIVLTSAMLVGSSDGKHCRSNHNMFCPSTSKNLKKGYGPLLACKKTKKKGIEVD